MLSHGENLCILMISQIGGAKQFASAPKNAALGPTFMYMHEIWLTYVSCPDVQKSLLRQ